MRVRFLNQNGLAALAILALAGRAFDSVQAGDAQKGEKIEFSEVPAGNPLLTSNLNRLNPNPGSFKQVKEDLLRPFNSLDPGNSLDMNDFMNGQFPPPKWPRSATLSKRTQEMLDKRRNWAFTTYEDLFPTETAEQMFGIKEYGPDGREKQAESVVQKYYESLDPRQVGATNQGTGGAESARAQFILENGFDPLGKSFADGDPFMKKLFGLEHPDALADHAEPIGLAGLPGLGISVIGTPDEVRSSQKRIDDIRQSILGDAAGRLAKSGEIGNALFDDYYSEKRNTALDQQLSDAAELKPRPANPFIVADPTANVLHSRVNDDLTARALGLPNPETVRTNTVSRPAPTAQSVAAEWDPYGASRPKPRF